MKKQRLTGIIAGLLVLSSLISVPLGAAQMGTSGGHDLDLLWSEAKKSFDLSRYDAVLLLESESVAVASDGSVKTTVHRVVWVGTTMGISAHADLRITYNSATEKLRVIKLRTWRDGKWWPGGNKVSDTAVVETLPFEIAGADDYTTMRETMLLHDGVELPCVMETEYEITRNGAPGAGHDGLWVFPRKDPAALVEYSVTVPGGKTLHIEPGETLQPEKETTPAGMLAYTWSMTGVDPLGYPRLEHPECYAPHVSWSTWKDWKSLGEYFTTAFERAAELGSETSDTLLSRVGHLPGQPCRAREAAAMVDEFTRPVNYDSRFRDFAPRPAGRTWETAYGHPLDRAVLAAGMFRKAGLKAEPVFLCPVRGQADPVPGLCRFGEIALLVDGDMYSALYHPRSGELDEGLRALHGKRVWNPAEGEAPRRKGPNLARETSTLELSLSMEPGPEGWKGGGCLKADGLLCPYGEMAGRSGRSLQYLQKAVSSVLGGTEVTGFNPQVFDRAVVSALFEFSMKEEEPDRYGRRTVTVGGPAGGLIDLLPDDIQAYRGSRTSPALLPGKMVQIIRLRLKAEKAGGLSLPEPRGLENECGNFALKVTKENGWITVERELKLNKTRVDPKAWPQLRALILEEKDPANRTIYIKKAK